MVVRSYMVGGEGDCTCFPCWRSGLEQQRLPVVGRQPGQLGIHDVSNRLIPGVIFRLCFGSSLAQFALLGANTSAFDLIGDAASHAIEPGGQGGLLLNPRCMLKEREERRLE